MKIKSENWYKEIWSLDIKTLSWVEETESQIDFIIKELKLTGEEKILDLGCGFGRHSLALAQKGFCVTGVDITPAYIDDATANAAKLNLNAKFICADIREIKFENEFDVVLNMADGAIGYLENDEENMKIFDRISSALKPNGKSFIDICNAEYATKHFPQKTWESGEKALSLAEFDWDNDNKRMLYGSYEYKYGEVATPPKYEAAPMRLYTKDEIKNIFSQRNMEIISTFSDFQGKSDSCDDLQLMVYSIKM